MAIMGSGLANGENRAVEAATGAISSPLLENICIDGATGIIINVTGGSDLTLWEVNEASTLITEAAHPDAEIIFGAVIDPNMGDNVSVTVIATGFGTPASKAAVQPDALMSAGLQRLNQELNTQSYEAINLSVEPPPSMVAPAAPAPVSMPIAQPAPVAQPAQFSLKPEPAAAPKGALPRDVLLAKARAYRESQMKSDGTSTGQEQLSLNMDDAMPPRLSPEPARSPFESDSLEVPSYLRRKRGLGTEQLDGE